MHNTHNAAPSGQPTEAIASPTSNRPPAFQFYVKDWCSDTQLSLVSLNARGLWIELLCRMWESSRQGYLLIAGRSPDLTLIARVVRENELQVSKALEELERFNVLSKTADGVIYCRRMVRDVEMRRLASAAGKKGGGNPSFVNERTFGGTFKGHPKGTPKGARDTVSATASACIPPNPPSQGGTDEPRSDMGAEAKPSSGFFAEAKAALERQTR